MRNRNEDAIFGCAGMLIITVGAVLLSTILNGWALSILWGWFVTPIFENAPTLTVPTAIGLAMVVSFMTQKIDTEDNDKSEKSFGDKIIAALGMAIGRPAITLLIGWIVLQFI